MSKVKHINITPKWILIGLVLIPFAIGQGSQGASYYKWVDKRHDSIYASTSTSERGQQSWINPQISLNTSPIKDLRTQSKKNFKDQNTVAETVDKAKRYTPAEAARRKKYVPECQKFHNELGPLQSGQRILTESPYGDRGILIDAERDNQIQQNMYQIQYNCL